MAPRNEYDDSAIRDEREEDLFTTIGKRVERLEIDDTVNVKRGKNEIGAGEDERAEAKVVDIIESLCMNCEENVGHPSLSNLAINNLPIDERSKSMANDVDVSHIG